MSQYSKNDSVEIHQLYEKSRKYWRKNLDSAYYLLHQVENKSKQVGYKRGEAYALYAMGFNEEKLFKEFQFCTQAYSIFESLHDQFGMGLTLLRIGTVYNRIGQNEKALEYFLRALEVKKKLDDYGGVALTLINIGKYYQERRLFEEALEYYKEALVYRLKEGTHQGKAYAQVNLAGALYDLNRFEESLAFSDSAIYNFSFTTDVVGQVWSLRLKGQNLKKLNDLKGAQKTFEKIVAYGEEAQFLGSTLHAKRELIKMYSNRGDIKRAFELQSEYIVAKDTLDKRDYRTETLRLTNEYEFKVAQQKALREKQLHDEQIARRNNLEYLSISIIVLLIFVILFSRKRRMTVQVINVLLLIGLLLLFEFLLILTDSSVEKITQGEPILKLLVNVVIALLILPGHQFLEKYSRKKLIEPA